MSSFCLILLNLLVGFSHGDWTQQGFNVEVAFGKTAHEITNPNSSKALYDGYGGHALVYYPIFQGENYSFGPTGKYFYSGLSNKANTTSLSEEIKFSGISPGLELKIYSFILGYNYRYQWMSVSMSGTLNDSVSTRMSSSQMMLGFELPYQSWAFRVYYGISSADLPHVDTGLSSDSPWTEETVFLAIRYRFGKSSSSPSYENPSRSSDDANEFSSKARDSIRYSPRPSPRLN